MSTDIKFSKSQISKIIQPHGSFVSWLSNLWKKAIANIAILLARDTLLGLVSNLTSNAKNKFEPNISGKGTVRAGERFGCINRWSYWNSKTWNKKTRRRISWSFLSTVSCFIKATSNYFSSKKYKWKRS